MPRERTPYATTNPRTGMPSARMMEGILSGGRTARRRPRPAAEVARQLLQRFGGRSTAL